MANDRPNRGRSLRPSIKRFAFNLITRLQVTTGLSYRALDKALGYPPATDSRCESYVSNNPKISRAGQAASLQNLEHRAAKFLGRPEFKIVIRNMGTEPLIGGNESLNPAGVPGEYKLPRTRREERRDSVLVTYERFADYVMQGYGENYPPPEEDVRIYLRQLALEAAQYDNDPEEVMRRKAWAAERLDWITQFIDQSAGNMPEMLCDAESSRLNSSEEISC